MLATEVTSRHNGVAVPEIRDALTRVLQSGVFLRSGQLQRLLRFLVEETLAGRGERLKEYVIGVEVFGRPPSYDPRIDSLVRVEARRLRATLATYYREDGSQDPVVVELEKGTYQPWFRRAADSAPASTVGSLQPDLPGSSQGKDAAAPALAAARHSGWRKGFAIAITVCALFAASILFLRSRRVHALTERDLIVIAEFSNTTGDAIFDETLKQGLTMELEQSPFLNIVSDRRAGETLKLMGRSPVDRLSQAVGREVCLRTGSKALVTGSIGVLGSRYVIGLTATNCSTGDGFAHVQTQAENKEGVLQALGTAATKLRGKLGESLSSIQKFDVPIEEATTGSLDAFQAYSMGRRVAREKGSPADIPYYKLAIALDPNFAVAYVALGVSYVNLGQPSVGSEYVNKAYELRGRISERERNRISAYYHHVVTGDLEKARATYEMWKQNYPRDVAPYINLGTTYTWLGEYEKSRKETSDALRLEPSNVLPYSNLAALAIKLGRPDEAKSILHEALSRKLNSKFVRENLYMLAFLQGDVAEMDRLVAAVRHKPGGEEDPLLSQQSDTEAYYGRLRKARELSRLAVESAQNAGAREAAAGWLINDALREAEYGNEAAARKQIAKALRLSPGRDVAALAALASARAGEQEQAEALLQQLERKFSSNTVIKVYWAPTIRAAIAIAERNPDRASQALESVLPYELGSPPPMGLATLYPVYLRGQAYLLKRQGVAAANEFHKVIDHPALVLNFPLHALSFLQLGRAQALSGDAAAARRSYQEFFRRWNEADGDIPILKLARAEYAQAQ
jgi:eukaryotic-like serine/threonine-protein kinase